MLSSSFCSLLKSFANPPNVQAFFDQIEYKIKEKYPKALINIIDETPQVGTTSCVGKWITVEVDDPTLLKPMDRIKANRGIMQLLSDDVESAHHLFHVVDDVKTRILLNSRSFPHKEYLSMYCKYIGSFLRSFPRFLSLLLIFSVVITCINPSVTPFITVSCQPVSAISHGQVYHQEVPKLSPESLSFILDSSYDEDLAMMVLSDLPSPLSHYSINRTTPTTTMGVISHSDVEFLFDEPSQDDSSISCSENDNITTFSLFNSANPLVTSMFDSNDDYYSSSNVDLVTFNDDDFQKSICDHLPGGGKTLCSASEYYLAFVSDYVCDDNYFNAADITGVEFLVNTGTVVLTNNSITSVDPIAYLPQICYLTLNDNLGNMDITDLAPLHTLSRLLGFYIDGNLNLYDISPIYRNIGLTTLKLANSSDTYSTGICRSETDSAFLLYLTNIFPQTASVEMSWLVPNLCSINPTSSSIYTCLSGTNPTQCPSMVLNQVYEPISSSLECSAIAKSGANGECYTIHDDLIRNYLKDSSNSCLNTSDFEANGIVSVATLRTAWGCSSLDLNDVIFTQSVLVASVNDITTLQGLEYAQGVDSDTGTPIGLTSLTLDGYDLSGDINDNAEYDKLVVQILAKAVTFGNIDSGLTHLSVSGCGLSAITDVLDLTPRANGDSVTQPFKLTYLDLSNNSISDVSVLLTSDLFPADALTTLDISSNNICDIDNVVTDLQSKFTNLSTLIYSDQTCHCSASVSSSAHQVCR
ncbi:Acidic leucine-rich nuclear phosphoprotein 32 like protein, partial [Aduncisulcus paluster]